MTTITNNWQYFNSNRKLWYTLKRRVTNGCKLENGTTDKFHKYHKNGKFIGDALYYITLHYVDFFAISA